jgi:Bromodomain
MGSQAQDNSRKRKHSSLTIAELEEQIADLRRKEGVVARHLARLGHQAAPPATAGSGPPAPRLSPYEQRIKQIKDNQALRLKNYWNDVRKEIRKLLKMNLVAQWFGTPVRNSDWGRDPVNWEHYSSKVAEPMDLTTIRDRLGEDDSSNRYSDPHEVMRDVRLIVSNCETFNVGDAGELPRKTSRTLQGVWERRWQPEDLSGLAYRWRELQAQTQEEDAVRARRPYAAAPRAALPCRIMRICLLLAARRFEQQSC